MKILVLGASGQLGKEIRSQWPDEIVAPSHHEFDITCDGGDDWFAGVDAVVNCAAFHNVDVCESEPCLTFLTNALAVDRLAARCAERAVPFMTISTDYVFDGSKRMPYSEDDCPHPLSVYGASKLAGELLLERHAGKSFVVRTCGVYGVRASASKGTFVDRIITQAQSDETIRVVDDVVASPTFAGHLAAAMRQLLDTEAYGLYHVCNGGAITWYDFAVKALELAGIDHAVQRISAEQWNAPARRPAYSALSVAKLERLGIHMPAWDDGILDYLRALESARR